MAKTSSKKALAVASSPPSSSSSTFRFLVIAALVIGVLGVAIHYAATNNRIFPRISIPDHLANHVAVIEHDLVPEQTAASLVDLMKQLKDYHSNVNQAKGQGFKPTYEHIGEGEGILVNKDGTCTHSLLYPNADKTMCILPERVDIGKHFVMTGGLDGVKENFVDLVDRVSSFGRYTFVKDLAEYPLIKSLFESEKFAAAAHKVCPADKPFLDPFQFNYIVQVPGQTVPIHIDAPYFWGASRYHFPQWLLACMLFSGLYQKEFVHQVQVVAYLHDWAIKGKGKNEEATSSSSSSSSSSARFGGEFVYFINDTSTQVHEPISFSGSFIDGSKMLHAARIYKPNVKAPHIDKDKETTLTFVGGDSWEVQSDGVVMEKYHTNDLRLSLVYRAKCFASQDEATQYSTLAKEDMMPLEEVLEKLSSNLVAQNKISNEKLKRLSRLELAFLLIDKYIVYPLPSADQALIPYNYCALARLYPWTSHLLRFVC